MSKMITQIKMLAGNRTELVLEDIIVKDKSKTNKRLTINSTDPVHPDFSAAGDALVPLIEHFLPFDGWGVDFKSINIKRNDNGFSAMYGLYLTPADDNYSGGQWQTPMLMVDSISGKNKMPELLYEKTQELIEQAQLFIDGKRAQADMFAAKTVDDKPKTDEELDQEEERKITPIGKTSRKKIGSTSRATAH